MRGCEKKTHSRIGILADRIFYVILHPLIFFNRYGNKQRSTKEKLELYRSNC